MDHYITCPYDKVHRVLRSRIQSHLVRCKSKRDDFAICLYNATHRLPQAEMREHLLNCPSMELMYDLMPAKAIANLTTPMPALRKTDPNEEIWDLNKKHP